MNYKTTTEKPTPLEYERPSLRTICLETSDVVRTSGLTDGGSTTDGSITDGSSILG